MNTSENSVQVTRTARYYSACSDVSAIQHVLIVLHGYAQLASDFIREFEFLLDKNYLIIAPEGLSKFYHKNKIGASWMTSDHRQDEIKDYLAFLETVTADISEKFSLGDARFNLLGFSQGVHTAVRMFIYSARHFAKLVLCSSDFPADADFVTLRKKLAGSDMYLVYGRNDPLIGESIVMINKSLLGENEIPCETIFFEGGHEINRDAVLKIFE